MNEAKRWLEFHVDFPEAVAAAKRRSELFPNNLGQHQVALMWSQAADILAEQEAARRLADAVEALLTECSGEDCYPCSHMNALEAGAGCISGDNEVSTETASFCVNASFALRGATKSSIKQEAWRRGLRLEIDEDKGWFSSTYYFTVSGPGAVQFQRDCIHWLQAVNEEHSARR